MPNASDSCDVLRTSAFPEKCIDPQRDIRFPMQCVGQSSFAEVLSPNRTPAYFLFLLLVVKDYTLIKKHAELENIDARREDGSQTIRRSEWGRACRTKRSESGGKFTTL